MIQSARLERGRTLRFGRALCFAVKACAGSLCPGLSDYELDKSSVLCYNKDVVWRGVAQFGRALRSGRRGRKFESCRLDSGLVVKRLRRRPLTA